MKTLTAVFLFLVFTIVDSFGQTNPHKTEFQRFKAQGKFKEAYDYLQQAYPQWDLQKMVSLCTTVGGAKEDPQPQGRFSYKYQRRILEAARVNLASDTDEQIGKKISQMWKVCDELDITICDNTKFGVANGNLIKFAINLKFEAFVLDIAYWKVDCNKVDESDGRTVLDYVQDLILHNKGLHAETTL